MYLFSRSKNDLVSLGRDPAGRSCSVHKLHELTERRDHTRIHIPRNFGEGLRIDSELSDGAARPRPRIRAVRFPEIRFARDLLELEAEGTMNNVRHQ